MSQSRSTTPKYYDLNSLAEVVRNHIALTAKMYNLDEPKVLAINTSYFELLQKFEKNTLLLIQIAKFLTLSQDTFVTTGIYKYLNGYLEYLADFGCQLQNSHKNHNIKQIKLFFHLLRKCDPKEFQLQEHRNLENLAGFIKVAQIPDSDIISKMITAIKSDSVSKVQKLIIENPELLHKRCDHILSTMEIGFNPSLLAAKYSQSPAMFTQGIFAISKLKSEKNKCLLSPPAANKEYGDYNALIVAAHWGTINMFTYLLSTIKMKTLDEIFAVLKAICAPYFNKFDNFAWLTNHLHTYLGINENDEEFINELPEFLDFTESTRDKFASMAELIRNKVPNEMQLPTYHLREHNYIDDINKFAKKFKGEVKVIPTFINISDTENEEIPIRAISLKRSR
jgi:hypothetical protein